MRRRRFALFLDLLNSIKQSKIDILDIGGTEVFWESMDFVKMCKNGRIRLTVLNVTAVSARHEFIESVTGDARDLSCFGDKQFDIAFSNSVIEHVGSYNDQKSMAEEIRRVGKRYFVQTPNYYFPIEPHFLFPFFQFLPKGLKIYLLRHFNLGWYKKMSSREGALKVIGEIRLLKLREFKELFPDAEIYKEKFLGLTKSFIAYRF
jgi:hypothetical protein